MWSSAVAGVGRKVRGGEVKGEMQVQVQVQVRKWATGLAVDNWGERGAAGRNQGKARRVCTHCPAEWGVQLQR